MQYLVLGATGYIGSYLYHRFKDDRCNVIGTSRSTVGNGELLYYDIKSNNIDKLLEKVDMKEKKTAIICIAESNINRCCENYNEAYDINVVKTKELICKLSLEGFHLIYFSSDNVFDGMIGNYTEESQTNPVNKYGLMKAEMEKYILQNVPMGCILRISKVVSMQMKKQNVFTEWLNQVETDSIRCIKGNQLSFVCIEDVYQACQIVAKKRMHGLYNIVGDKSYSRAELARVFYERLGVLDVDIRECGIEEFDFKDSRPLNISMDNMKFKSETGYQFMSMEEVIKEFMDSIRK